MVQAHPVFKVPDRPFTLSVAAMIPLQIQKIPYAVGDEKAVAVATLIALQQRPQVLGYPAHDQAHALTVALLVEGSTRRLGDIGSFVVRNRDPVALPQNAGKAADRSSLVAGGNREISTGAAAGADEFVVVEAGVGTHGYRSPGAGVAGS